MKKEMLINVLQPEECRIAIVEDGVLEELYVERTSHESYTGNIYKGKVVNLEPAIQAAFVDFSVGRNGFLHVSDVEPQYYHRHVDDAPDPGPRDRSREPRRDRDEPRPPRGEERGHRPPPPAADDRYRERPDRSEKGRKDRSKRFGEGLIDDWDLPPPPIPPLPFPEPPIAEEPPASVARHEEPDPFSWSVRREPPAPKIEEPEEPHPLFARDLDPPTSLNPIEAELPPSRTHRTRPTVARTSPPPSEIEESAAPPFRRPDDDIEPRRGWGRRRPPGARDEFEPPAPDVPLAELEPEPFVPLDDSDPPRRRGGRSAIRSRGGEREPARPRGFEPPAERIREPGEELLADEPPRPRGRRRDIESPVPPARKPPHDRAGERGYVPRRERIRPSEPDLAPDSDILDDDDAVLDLEPEAPESAEDTPSARDEGRPRRRRRRGRRRDRPEREIDAEGKLLPESELEPDIESDLEDLDDDEIDEPPRPAPPPRRRAAGFVPKTRDDRPRRERTDDFDFGDEEEDEIDPDVATARELLAPLDPEDEIDPELEEEIRREIEEIAELETEMGLRGTTEARPRRGDAEASPRGGRVPRGRGLSKPPMQDIFRRGDEVLVQVIKESIGTKGPTLSTYISIPGRYLVLMPGLNRVGVSRKIADEGQRRRLREIMNALNPPKGLGFIVRTAGLDRTKKELARDLAYLLRLWKVILRRIKKAKSPAPIYQESDMITRTIRDIFTSEIDTIWIDEPAAFERAQEFLRVVMPKFVNRLKLHDDKVPLFHKYGLEEEIVKIQRRRVEMPEGGSLVIDQTEALVAIDVNSGNFRVENDAERTAYEMNLRAAKEIARQLRLRDLGGVICNDFIDMRDERNCRNVERALRDAVKRDRARTKILRMSQFGIIEMTRQRIRPSLKRSVYEDCPHCVGAGVVKTAESMAIDVMRLLALASHRDDIRRVNVCVNPAVETYLNNRKRRELGRLETEGTLLIHIRSEEDFPPEHLQIDCFDAQNNEVRILPPPPAPRRGR